MKRIMVLKIFVLFMVSCNQENTDNEDGHIKVSTNTVFGEVFHHTDFLLGISTERSVNINDFDLLANYSSGARTKSLNVTSNLIKAKNVGDFFVNNIKLDPSYYGVTYFSNKAKKIDHMNSLSGGKIIKIYNKNYSDINSYLCGVDFTYNAPYSLSLKVERAEPKNVIRNNNPIVSWRIEGNPNDAVLILLISNFNVDNNKTQPVKHSRMLLKNSDGKIELNNELLSPFENGDEVDITIIRGNQYTYIHPNNKTLGVLHTDTVTIFSVFRE